MFEIFYNLDSSVPAYGFTYGKLKRFSVLTSSYGESVQLLLQRAAATEHVLFVIYTSGTAYNHDLRHQDCLALSSCSHVQDLLSESKSILKALTKYPIMWLANATTGTKDRTENRMQSQ
jgi:hypothetical protein